MAQGADSTGGWSAQLIDEVVRPQAKLRAVLGVQVRSKRVTLPVSQGSVVSGAIVEKPQELGSSSLNREPEVSRSSCILFGYAPMWGVISLSAAIRRAHHTREKRGGRSARTNYN